MKWKLDTREYVSGERLYLGPWSVGGAYHDSTVPHERLDRYRATCALPGISQGLGLHPTLQAAKERVEQAVKSWLEQLPACAIKIE